MYCPKCGKEIPEGSLVCPVCKRGTGVTVQKPQNYNYQSPYNQQNSRYEPQRPTHGANDFGGAGWWILGFLCSGLIALVVYLCCKDNYPNRMHSFGWGAIWGIIVAGIVTVLSIILVSCTACIALV